MPVAPAHQNFGSEPCLSAAPLARPVEIAISLTPPPMLFLSFLSCAYCTHRCSFLAVHKSFLAVYCRGHFVHPAEISSFISLRMPCCYLTQLNAGGVGYSITLLRRVLLAPSSPLARNQARGVIGARPVVSFWQLGSCLTTAATALRTATI